MGQDGIGLREHVETQKYAQYDNRYPSHIALPQRQLDVDDLPVYIISENRN
jgi:hypothetical protein